jgi:predicted transcriptional regulator
MQSDILFHSLINLGISVFDAKLYQYLLENPNYSVSQIASDIGTNRVRIYDSFKRLQEHNLLDKLENGSLAAVSPNKILSELRLKEVTTKKLSNDLEVIIPELLYKIQSKNKNPIVKVYEGKASFVRLATEIVEDLQPNSEILWIAEGDELYDLTGFDYFIEELDTRRHNKAVVAKILASHKSRLRTDAKLTREFRFLPSNFETPGTITIAGNKVIFWNTIIPKVIVIEDAITTKVQTQIFYLLWKNAEIRE